MRGQCAKGNAKQVARNKYILWNKAHIWHIDVKVSLNNADMHK